MESLTRQALMLALRPELGSQRARCLFVPGVGVGGAFPHQSAAEAPTHL